MYCFAEIHKEAAKIRRGFWTRSSLIFTRNVFLYVLWWLNYFAEIHKEAAKIRRGLSTQISLIHTKKLLA